MRDQCRSFVAVATGAIGRGVRVCDDNFRKRGQHRATRAGARVGAQLASRRSVRLGIAYFKANRFAEARDSAPASRVDGTVGRRRGAVSRPDRRSAKRSCRRRERPTIHTSRWVKTRGVKNQIAERLTRHRAKRTRVRRQARDRAGAAAVLRCRFAAHGRRHAVRVHRKRHVAPPLERGFAELVATDLSRSAQITVVERDRLQALLDEMRLSSRRRDDGSASVRANSSGRTTRRRKHSPARSRSAPRERIPVERADRANAGHGRDRPAADRPAVHTREEHRASICSPTWASRSRPPSETRSSSGRRDRWLRFWRTVTASRHRTLHALTMRPVFRQRSPSRSELPSRTTEGTGNEKHRRRQRRDRELDRIGTSRHVLRVRRRRGPSSANTALSTADGLNPSITAGATGGGIGPTTQPAKDPASGTGGDNVTTKTAKVTIVIRQPKP